MALRGIYSIDVDDSAFKNFHATFEKYQRAVMRLPAAWREVSAEAVKGKNAFADMAAAMMAQAELLHRAQQDSAGLSRNVTSAGRGMAGLARHTKEVAAGLLSATRTLVRWTGITTAATGLVGGGSLWGIERLAMHAGDIRRSALGLGISPAEQQASVAFRHVLGQDPRAFMGQLLQYLETAEGKTALLGAGVGQNMWGRNSAQLLYPFLSGVQNIAKGAPPGLLGNVLQSRGLGNVPLDLAETLRGMSRKELSEWNALFEQQTSALREFNSRNLLTWAKFDLTLDLAWQKIEDVFINRTRDLAGPLSKLSEAATNVITSFLQGPGFAKLIVDVSGALDRFANYVGSESFVSDVESFVSGVGSLAKAVGNAVAWFTRQFGGDSKESPKTIEQRADDAAKSALGTGKGGGGWFDFSHPGQAVLGAAGGAAFGSMLGPLGALVGGAAGFSAGAIGEEGRRNVGNFSTAATGLSGKSILEALALGPVGIALLPHLMVGNALSGGRAPNQGERAPNQGNALSILSGWGDRLFGAAQTDTREATTRLRDWLLGTGTTVPRVRLETDAASGGGGFLDTISKWVHSLFGGGGSTDTPPAPPSSGGGIMDTLSNWGHRLLGMGGGSSRGSTTLPWYTGSAPASVAAEHGGFNVAGIRAPGGGFRTYDSAYAGVADLGDLLKSYVAQGQDTLHSIINKWAPPTENNTGLLIARAARWTGLDPNAKLDLKDPKTLRSVMEAMNRNEFGGKMTMSPEALDAYVSGRGPAHTAPGAEWLGATPSSTRLREFVKNASGLDPARANWCAAFADAVLASDGKSNPHFTVATDFMKYGSGTSPEAAQAGDVVVLPRGHGPGQTGGHVGIATGHHLGKLVGMISGNRNNQVQFSWENPQEISVRHPSGIRVNIENSTGGSIPVIANQVRH